MGGSGSGWWSCLVNAVLGQVGGHVWWLRLGQIQRSCLVDASDSGLWSCWVGASGSCSRLCWGDTSGLGWWVMLGGCIWVMV